MKLFLSTLTLFFVFIQLDAQENKSDVVRNDSATIFRRTVIITAQGDTVPIFALQRISVFGLLSLKSEKERMAYTRLVRDVRKTHPYAKLIAQSIIETYEFMETLPDEKSRQKHMESVQNDLLKTYKPEMKKMTKTQGQILMKLIDRECNTSSYNIVKAMVGDFKAGLYNVFAGLFGNSLKTRYEPLGKDSDIESIVIQIEEGSIDYYYTLNYRQSLHGSR